MTQNLKSFLLLESSEGKELPASDVASLEISGPDVIGFVLVAGEVVLKSLDFDRMMKMRDSVDADLGLKEELRVDQELHEFKIGLIFIRLSPTTL